MEIGVNGDMFLKRVILIPIIFLIVLLATWQDCFLSDSFGEIFKSPIVLITPFFFISEYFLQKTNGFYLSKISRIYVYFHLFYIVVTILYLVIWMTGGNGIGFLGENIFLKSIKQILYYSFFWGLFRCFYLALQKADAYNIKVDNIFTALIVIYIFISVWEVKTMPFAFPFFHTVKEYTRPRLLTGESSGTGSIALLLISGLCLGKRNTIKIVIASSFMILFVALSGSKMFLVGAAISILLLNVKLIKRYKLIAVAGFLMIVVLFNYFVLPKLIDSLTYDIDNATSVTTRSLWYISSLRSIYLYPIGTGGLSAAYFLKTFNSSIAILNNFYPDLNFSEALLLGSNGAKGVQAGSTFGNFVVLLGLPGLWLLIKLLRILVKAAKNNFLLSFFVIYFIITNLTTESMENKFTYSIFFAIIAYLADKKIKTQELKNENISSVA